MKLSAVSERTSPDTGTSDQAEMKDCFYGWEKRTYPVPLLPRLPVKEEKEFDHQDHHHGEFQQKSARLVKLLDHEVI